MTLLRVVLSTIAIVRERWPVAPPAFRQLDPDACPHCAFVPSRSWPAGIAFEDVNVWTVTTWCGRCCAVIGTVRSGGA